MTSIWQEMVDTLSKKESFVVATIFDKSGSSPRTAGAKMIIKADGSIVGTIGGGKLEGDTKSLAKEVFQSRAPVIQHFNLTNSDAAQMDMICGGMGEVLLDYVDASEENNLEIFTNIVDVLKERKKAWLVTILANKNHNQNLRQQCLIKEDGTMLGIIHCERDFLQSLISGPGKISIHSETLEDQRLLIEPIRNTGTLYIFGAGHVSQQIAPVAEMVGFKTIVLDDRKEYANQKRFPKSQLILLESLAEPLPELPFDGDSYLVIVTRGHMHDKNILGQLLRKPVPYIGMIGSRRKRDTIYQTLIKEKGFEIEELKKVHCPIGLEILAETPEEIAISIIAELIKIRAEKEKCPMKK